VVIVPADRQKPSFTDSTSEKPRLRNSRMRKDKKICARGIRWEARGHIHTAHTEDTAHSTQHTAHTWEARGHTHTQRTQRTQHTGDEGRSSDRRSTKNAARAQGGPGCEENGGSRGEGGSTRNAAQRKRTRFAWSRVLGARAHNNAKASTRPNDCQQAT
jgi:hypothetical protein